MTSTCAVLNETECMMIQLGNIYSFFGTEVNFKNETIMIIISADRCDGKCIWERYEDAQEIA